DNAADEPMSDVAPGWSPFGVGIETVLRHFGFGVRRPERRRVAEAVGVRVAGHVAQAARKRPPGENPGGVVLRLDAALEQVDRADRERRARDRHARRQRAEIGAGRERDPLHRPPWLYAAR